MTAVNICLDSIDKVKSFVNEITKFCCSKLQMAGWFKAFLFIVLLA